MTWVRTLSTVLLPLLMLLFLATPVAAQDGIVEVEAGEPAPFTGMLFPTETAVRWRFRIETLTERLRLDVERCESVASLRLQLCEDTRQVRETQHEEDREMLRGSIVAASDRPWYESFEFGLVIGVLAVVLVGGLAVGLAVGLAP